MRIAHCIVKAVCPALPRTADGKRGAKVRDNKDILPGTVIATFNAQDQHEGHAAIYESQSAAGVKLMPDAGADNTLKLSCG
jgi:hypothetical protein